MNAPKQKRAKCYKTNLISLSHYLLNCNRYAAGITLLAIILALSFSQPPVFSQEGCYECHGDFELNGLYVDSTKFAVSVHGEFECIACHVAGPGHPEMQANVSVDL